MFTRILIANRGEIACRVIATCHRLGVSTVAVFSDADAGAKHVALADAAVRLGPPPAADSYLRGERIVAAALATGAEAIHPGYGFLAENPDFVDAVDRRRPDLHRPARRRHPRHGAEGRRQGADAARRGAGGAGLPRRRPERRRLAVEARRSAGRS